MNVSPKVAELALAFWLEAGEVEPFPRTLRRFITRTLPVSLVETPRLRLESVRAWLRGNNIYGLCRGEDRPLRACLVARSGHGVIFLDGGDNEVEQRFSLAHELGHFLRHYWRPRKHAQERCGEQISDVFDGRRPPLVDERIRAILKNVALGFHLHLMDRGPSRQVASNAIARAEDEADELAFELLAPTSDVKARLDVAGREKLVAILQAEFGLPAEQAIVYGRLLLPETPRDPLLKRLRS